MLATEVLRSKVLFQVTNEPQPSTVFDRNTEFSCAQAIKTVGSLLREKFEGDTKAAAKRQIKVDAEVNVVSRMLQKSSELQEIAVVGATHEATLLHKTLVSLRRAGKA